MLDLATAAVGPRVLTVGELNRLARAALEQHLPLCWVAGEISNFKRYDSGHCYFTLKDESAQVECVMFRQKAMLLGWQPESGMQVEVRACATLYEARGRYQITVESMRRMSTVVAEDVVRMLRGDLPKNLVNPEVATLARSRWASAAGSLA